jgi:hypothetical protein
MIKMTVRIVIYLSILQTIIGEQMGQGSAMAEHVNIRA